MKKKILMILCVMVCAILCIALVACGEKDVKDPEENDDLDDSLTTDEESGDEAEALKLDSKSFNIFYDIKYVSVIVLPKNATDIEQSVASKLKSELQAKTGKNAIVAFEGDERITEDSYLILIGNTSYEESKNAYKGLAERSAKIKTTKNIMAIAFKNESSGLKVVEKLVAEFGKCDKKEVKVKLGFTASYTSLPEKHEFVEYTGGTTEKLDYENGTVLYIGENNTLDAVKAYCATLESIGFKGEQERTLSGHFFKALKGEQEYVYIYYVDSVKTNSYEKIAAGSTNSVQPDPKTRDGVVKIAVGPIETFAETDMTGESTKTSTPKLAMILNPSTGSAEDNGQGYIFVLPDGRLIIQDSGLVSYAHEDFVYETIKEVAPDPNNVVIAAWFISHPHGDHQGGFFEFIQKHGSDEDIKIERVVYNYAKAECYDVLRYDSGKQNGEFVQEKCASAVKEFYTKTEQYIPEVPLLMAHTGQMFNFGNDVTVEVLFTVEDLLPDEFVNVNNSSMVIRVTIGGQKVLLFADTAHKSNPMVKSMWESYLKSDIVQIAHHGIWTPDDGIYEVIGAKVYLWPASYISARASFNHNNNAYREIVNKIYGLASDIYVADGAAPVKVLDIPYVIKGNGNKTAEKDRIYGNN